ncbi:MAG: sugar phosphate isomerase/epimerase [Victivallales bacterium]|nr:sugar phosphate isomerase/epimerase [Victivallales bacterium]
MLKSISYWSFPKENGNPCPIETAMRLAKDYGYDAIELTCDLNGPLNPDTTHKECSRWREAADKIGIALQSVASGMCWAFSPTDNSAEVRKQSVLLQKAALDRCAWLGAQTLLHVPGAIVIPWDKSYKPVKYDVALKRAAEAVAELGEHAANLGIELGVENVWNGLFYSPVEFASFIDSFDNPAVGAYFDIGNILNHQQWPPHWIEILGKRIRRIHVKDFKCSVGNLSGFCDLCDGDVPWAETIQALRAIGYDKTLTAEMGATADVLPKTSKALDKILAM